MPANRRTTCSARASGLSDRRWKTMLLATSAIVAATPLFSGKTWAQAPSASAQNTAGQFAFNIPRQSLTSAMIAFQGGTGMSLLADGSVPQNVISPGVSGASSAGSALQKMLAGTGLSYSVNGNTARIFNPSAGGNDASATVDGAIALDTIDVSGGGNATSGSGYQGTPDWVYETPAGVSVISREAIQSSSARNARDLFDNVAGVYANRSEAQKPGVSVNIRGLQDQDRVAMMIDGARQTFQRAGHGSSQQTYVDTAFVRGIEIEKSSTSGSGSAGSLGGLVNFRTVVADDLIQAGRQYGTEVNVTVGTNGFEFDGSIATALRVSESLSILGGISRKKIGPYEVGKSGIETLRLGNTYDSTTMLFSGQEVLSTILKAEAKIADDMKLTLGWMRGGFDYSTGAYNQLFLSGGLRENRQQVVNNTLTAAFEWKPSGDLIDFKSRVYYNHLTNKENTILHNVPAGISLSDDYSAPGNYRMATLGGSLENTSRLDTPFGTLSFNYGGEAFHDNGETILASYVAQSGGGDYSDILSGSTPSGKRTVASGFSNAKLEHGGWLTVQGGLRYDWFHTSGHAAYLGSRTRDIIREIPGVCRLEVAGVCRIWTTRPQTIYSDYYYPVHEVDVDRSEGAWLPSATVSVKPFDWLQPFLKYSQSFRPPTIMETYLNGGHAGSVTGYQPNPNLEPERAETWELGVNIARNALFLPDDTFRMKVVGFRRNVDNYIATAFVADENGSYGSMRSFTNILGTIPMKGVEIEANYDARRWYIGGTMTTNRTDWPDRLTYNDNGSVGYGDSGLSIIFVQPEVRYAIDGGIRFFDKKLTIGGRMTYVGKTEPTIGTLQNNYKLANYRTYDLYGSYAFNENAKLQLNISNLTDQAYISALGADYYAMPGRTATVGLQLKF